MTNAEIDPERLAALLDGRLSGRDRDAVVEQLAASEEMLAVYADAVAVSGAEEGNAARTGDPVRVTPLRVRRRWVPRAAALAAVLAGLVAAPWQWNRMRAAPPGPGRFAVLLERSGGGLPADWESRPWSSTRGAGDGLSENARAARLGALQVDLRVAVAAGDRPAAELLLAQIQGHLDNMPSGGLAADPYRRLQSGEGEAAPLLKDGEQTVADLVPADWLRAGAWAEGASLAARRGDARYFRSAESRAALAAIGRLEGLPPDAASAAERLRRRSVSTADEGVDFAAARSDADALLGALGS
ncbi:MAG TPA: hypothetical protein VFQ45_21555 [Longimicrobium sp.]|nr:hypothetical protein [Longimicrobium sp.]